MNSKPPVRDNNLELLKCLKKYWGYTNFLEGQLEICLNVLYQQDSFVIMATGSGKSLTFQLPAIYLREKGIRATTIVISPLISLIDDQVASLLAMGINACAIGSNSNQDIELKASQGEFSIIYATPEKILNWIHGIQQIMIHSKLICIAIDESHCVSEWGHDFRPDYRRLGELRSIISKDKVPLIALTASATIAVQADIIRNLRLNKPLIAKSSLNRFNLKYCVLARTTPSDLLRVMFEYRKEQLIDIIRDNKDRSSIPFYSTLIYVNSKKETEELAHLLVDCKQLAGIKVAYYHAGMAPSQRSAVHMAFAKDEIQVIVATVAFGMGINKPDVRLVIHYGMTKSVEAYYQQTGRAGRDGLPAKCILLFNRKDIVRCFNIASNDLNLNETLSTSLLPPEPHHIQLSTEPSSINNHNNILTSTTAWSYEDHIKQTPIQRLNHQLHCMKEYATTCGSIRCRRKFLLQYFGDDDISTITNGSPNCCDLCDEIITSNTLVKSSLSHCETKSNISNIEYTPQDQSNRTENANNNRSTSNNNNNNPSMDISYEVHILLYTIIDCKEMYGIGVPLAILLGKHEKSLQRIPNYNELTYFGAGSMHSIDWWKAIANQLIEIDNYIETILTKKTHNAFSYQRYTVTMKGRFYLSGITFKEYEKNNKNGYYYLPKLLFNKDVHIYQSTTIHMSSELKKWMLIENNSKHNIINNNTNNDKNKNTSYSHIIFSYLPIGMAFDVEKVTNYIPVNRIEQENNNHTSSNNCTNNNSSNNNNSTSNKNNKYFQHYLNKDTTTTNNNNNQNHSNAHNEYIKQQNIKILKTKLRIDLLNELKKLRYVLAQRTSMNPYDIIGAPELERLVDNIPCNISELSNIPGFNDWKVNNFGQDILKTVQLFKNIHKNEYNSLYETTINNQPSSSSSIDNNISNNNNNKNNITTKSNEIFLRPTVKLFHPNYEINNSETHNSYELSPAPAISQAGCLIINLIDNNLPPTTATTNNNSYTNLKHGNNRMNDFSYFMDMNEAILASTTTTNVNNNTEVSFNIDKDSPNCNNNISDKTNNNNIINTSNISDNNTSINNSNVNNNTSNIVAKPSDIAWKKRQLMNIGLGAYKSKREK